MAIWVIKDGQREGPYDEDDVRELIYEGTYTDNDPAIRDGQYDWSTIGNVLEPMSADLPPIAESRPDLDFPDEEIAPEAPLIAEPVDMPFGSMVTLLFKWAAASFVVLFILGAVLGALWAILAILLATMLR
jgi:hypothetical protein